MRSVLAVFYLGLLLAILTSCGSGSAAPNNASLKDAGKETTSVVEVAEAAGTVEETAEPTGRTTPEEEVAEGPRPSASTATEPAVGANGMVSSAHPLATRAGLNILEEGGSAFDAAVAVGAALNVVEPFMSGVGGYGATVVHDAESGETRFLETGSRTPAALDTSVFRPPAPNFAENRCGPLAVSTPGTLNAWETMWGEYGELEWEQLFRPAVELADEGFYVGDVAAGWIDASYPYMPENAQAIYGSGAGPLRSGALLVQQDLANSFRLIAEEGADTMYSGQLGQAIETAVQESGGALTLEDLENNRAAWRETVSLDYGGYEVVTASLPSTAWGALLRLGVMGQLEPSYAHNSTQYLHTFAEASKQAGLVSRDYITDPETRELPLDLLYSEEFMSGIAQNINPAAVTPTNPSAAPFNPTPTRCPPQSYSDTGSTSAGPSSSPTSTQAVPQSHTTHFVVADSEGNVVSSTQTIGNIFGSKVMPEGTGIWLNDELAWNRFEPAGNVFDTFAGGQSLYALCPTIITSGGRPVGAIGTPGGRTIPSTTPQMLMNILDFGMDVQSAISAPRISTTFQNSLLAESGVPPAVRDGLAALGHDVRVDERGFGNAHGLTIEYGDDGRPERFTGGADPRGEGAAEGL